MTVVEASNLIIPTAHKVFQIQFSMFRNYFGIKTRYISSWIERNIKDNLRAVF